MAWTRPLDRLVTRERVRVLGLSAFLHYIFNSWPAPLGQTSWLIKLFSAAVWCCELIKGVRCIFGGVLMRFDDAVCFLTPAVMKNLSCQDFDLSTSCFLWVNCTNGHKIYVNGT